MDPKLLRRLPRTVRAGTILGRAAIVPSSFDEKNLECDVVMSAGAQVVRAPWFGDPYIEELGMEPENVRLDRLKSGRAPLLDSHSTWSLESQIGRILSARLEDGKLIGRLQFSDREQVAWIVRDVQRGIIQNISIGYRKHRIKDVSLEGDKMRRLRAVDWEPYECSLVVVPADPNAAVREIAIAENERTTEGVLVGRAAELFTECQIDGREASAENMDPEIDPTNPTNTPTETRANPAAGGAPAAPASGATAQPATDPAAVAARAVEAERARCQEATRLGAQHQLGNEWVARMQANPQADIATIQRSALEELARRSAAAPISSHVQVGADARQKAIAAAERALSVRMGVEADHTPESRDMRGFSVARTAEVVLQAAGVQTRGLSVTAIAELGLKGRMAGAMGETRGMQGTDDFTHLLANVQGKAMRKAYEAQEQTWLAIARRNEASDFKPMKRIQISGGTALQRVNDHGEVKRGSFQDEAETYNLETEGLIVGFTRKAFVNDDLGELGRMTRRMGARAADRRSDLAWSLITGNTLMADGNQLFSVAHANLHPAGAGSALQESSLITMLASYGVKKDKDGNLIQVRPGILAVPVALYVAALKLTTSTSPNQASEVNVWPGIFKKVIAEARLDAASLTAWYTFASPDQVDVLEFSELAGNSGPQVTQRNGWDVDGVEFRILDDFGVSVLEHVSAYKSPGA